jgi:dipeptidyl aminopeptidase/acylaminoacyl peptidase
VRVRGSALAVAALVSGLALAGDVRGQSTAEYVPQPARSEEFELSIRSIMRGPELVGEAPTGVQWSDDGEWVYFRWRPGGGEWDDEREQYRVRADGSGLERVADSELDSIGLIAGPGALSEDGRQKVVSAAGDLYLVDRRSLETRRLTDTRDAEIQPAFIPGEDAVLYRSGMNLFRLELDDGAIRQVTDIRGGNPPADQAEPEGHRAFLEEQQVELFEHIRRQKAREEEEEARREAVAEDGPEPLYISNGERVQGMEPSPDGSWVLVTAGREASSARRTMIPFWITESGYTEPRDVRTKVGDVGGRTRLGLLDTATGESVWLDPDPDAPAADRDGEPSEPARAASTDGEAEGSDREWSASARGWNEVGTHALVYHRSGDDTEWVLSALEGATGERTILARHRDEAWVGGPCGFGCVGWLPDEEGEGAGTVYYVSEETGYAHVYLVNADGTGRRALTSGEWEVLDLELAPDEERFFVTTNEGSPFDQHIGWLEFDGERTYLSAGIGRYEGTLSPDGERIAVVHDVANRPPELYLAEVDELEDAAEAAAEAYSRAAAGGVSMAGQAQSVNAPMIEAMTRVTDSPVEEWAAFPWIHPEIVRFPARDGVEVPARIYRPEDVGGTPNGAAVVFVHGAGYLHNVHNYWSSYYREYMFHHLLAAQGYTVLDIDYRGSAGYGSEWRTAIYRFMGGKDLTDQEDGARWLVANEGIDADRIGIYGGSYGGFITLMALFTADDTFKAGAALRSVTDWAHYNDGYTSNILNDPQEDLEAYLRSSPIYHVENFRADQHLLILHGMVDTNVHFSDVVRYAQRLIELGKENWEFAVYPVENHGFVEPSSWTDEYRRIFELFERTISEPGCTEGGGLCAVPGR